MNQTQSPLSERPPSRWNQQTDNSKSKTMCEEGRHKQGRTLAQSQKQHGRLPGGSGFLMGIWEVARHGRDTEGKLWGRSVVCFPVRWWWGGREGGARKRAGEITISERISSICKGPRKGTVLSHSCQFFWKAADKECSQEKGGELASSPVRLLS